MDSMILLISSLEANHAWSRGMMSWKAVGSSVMRGEVVVKTGDDSEVMLELGEW